LYEAYGIHPRYLGDDPYNDLLYLRDLIQTRPMVAIGECGLDLLNNEQLTLQTEIFTLQIKLANEFHLPLIIHCRQLDQQLFDILKNTALDSSMKIQWHCCHSKGASVYREFLKYFPSSLLSIGGMCCHSGEKNLQRLIQELYETENQRRFVFETDSPYLKSSSLLIDKEDNCPILGTLTASAYVTKNVLKNDQWTNNLKINTTILQQFFNLI
jgi:TatD DNase family protein